MNYSLLSGIFLEGILSFLSPCVLPLVPLYMSYLAGENKTVDEEGNVKYDNFKVFLITVFFVLGICFTFVILSLALNAFKDYLSNYTEIISIIGGVLLIIFGLHQLGIIHIDLFEKQFKLNVNLHLEKMNFVKAFLLGLVFSLGWTPCIGPMLANAILMASTSTNGYLYILVYALGLIIPFLITGLFTSTVLNYLNKNKNILKWVLKMAGVVLLLFGCYMIYNASKSIVELKNINHTITSGQMSDANEQAQEIEDIENYLYNYEFKDVKDNPVKLADYSGKYIMVNFTTTWCNFCREEIKEYTSFAQKHDDIECLYFMSPLNESSGDAIEKYIEEQDMKLNVVVDETATMFRYCGISGYPTKFVISPEGKFLTYVSGALTEDVMEELYNYAKGLENQ